MDSADSSKDVSMRINYGMDPPKEKQSSIAALLIRYVALSVRTGGSATPYYSPDTTNE